MCLTRALRALAPPRDKRVKTGSFSQNPLLEREPSRSSLHGTLMRVARWERLPDNRLAVVVQGLARAVVVRETKAAPYARADVQVLPDSEALRERQVTTASDDHDLATALASTRRAPSVFFSVLEKRT